MTTNLLLELPVLARAALAGRYPDTDLVTLTIPLGGVSEQTRMYLCAGAVLHRADGTSMIVDLENSLLGEAITSLQGFQFPWERRPLVIVLGEDPGDEQGHAMRIYGYQVSWEDWSIPLYSSGTVGAARSAYAMHRRLSDRPAVFTVSDAATSRANPPTQVLFAADTA